MKETGRRVRRPPQTSKETIETLKEADQRYEASKTFLFGSDQAANKAKSTPRPGEEAYDPLTNVPRGMTLSRLFYPPSKSEIVLVGLKRRAPVHSSYIYDLLQEMRPETVFVQLNPDQPYFIKNIKPKINPDGKESDKRILYKDIWYQFLKKAKDAAFLANPRPKFTSDAVLNKDKIKRFFEDNVIPAENEFEVGPNTVYSQGKSMLDMDLHADSYLTAMLYAYNTGTDKANNIQVVLGDMPTLMHRELVGRGLRLNQAQDIFKRTVLAWEDQGNPHAKQGLTGLKYQPEVHEFKEIIVEPRVNYISELLRQVSHVSRRVVAIIDEGFLPHVEDKWQRLPRNLRALDSFYYQPP